MVRVGRWCGSHWARISSQAPRSCIREHVSLPTRVPQGFRPSSAGAHVLSLKAVPRAPCCWSHPVPWNALYPLDVGSAMTATTIPESHRDLLEADIAILATIGSDMRPQLSAVWFLLDDDAIRLSLNTSRQKVRNLRANPAINLFILDRDAPTRYLEIRGDAEVVDDSDYALADRVGQKYGADLRTFDGADSHRVAVTIRPTRGNAVDMAAGG